MRKAALVAVAAVLAVPISACGVVGRQPGDELCDALESSIELAISGSNELPDPQDMKTMHDGSCSTKKTKHFDAHLPGYDKHSEFTIAGRIFLSHEGGDVLRRAKVAAKDDEGRRVTALPTLGPHAFLVTQVAPSPASGDTGAMPVGAADPAADLPLPATAYWQHGSSMFTLSATRDGATVADAERLTTRAAELVDRLRVDPGVDLTPPS